jgi:hypothetical protein
MTAYDFMLYAVTSCIGVPGLYALWLLVRPSKFYRHDCPLCQWNAERESSAVPSGVPETQKGLTK